VTTEGSDDGGGIFVVKKIDTKEQLADIFTLGLGPSLVAKLREKLMGW
jgi:hypothetical protein